MRIGRALLSRILSELYLVCPAFEPAGPVAKTGKSLAIDGSFDGQHAVAKVLVEAPPGWRGKVEHEAKFLRQAASNGSPVPVPALLFADTARGVLILEHVDGAPLADDRYPFEPVDNAGLDALLDALPLLHRWTPWAPPSPIDVITGYEERWNNTSLAGCSRARLPWRHEACCCRCDGSHSSSTATCFSAIACSTADG